MAVTAPKAQIPTVADAVERFLVSRQRQSWREHASVLSGPPSGRTIGRKAAGTALARSDLGTLRFDRVTAEQFQAWLFQRHPPHLAPSSFRRGRSSLRQLLVFAAANGWAEDRIADTLPAAKPSPARRDWLRPEQLVVIERYVDFETHDWVAEDQYWMWHIALNTGLRATELVTLQPSNFNFLDATVSVVGKGGKRRDVPLPFMEKDILMEWFEEQNFRPQSWLFPLRGYRFTNTRHKGASERIVLDPAKHCDVKAFRAFCAKLYERIREDAKAGDFPRELVPSRCITPHTLRRTYACNQLIASEVMGPEHGMSLRMLQEAMGHSSLEQTALYLADVGNYLGRHRRPICVTSEAFQLVGGPPLRSSASVEGRAA